MSALPEKWGLGPLRFRRFYGDDDRGGWSPYLSKLTLRCGRWSIGIHKFHRGDADPDCHDHPFDFWTFPLTSYVEEVVHKVWTQVDDAFDPVGIPHHITETHVVHAGHIHYRPANYTHRVLGKFAHLYSDGTLTWRIPFPGANPCYLTPRNIWTIVLKRSVGRPWGFLKNRNGKWCWQGWNDYINNGGKNVGCDE